MPPKKTKDSPVLTWQDTLVQYNLNDESWSVKVVIIEAAGSAQDRLYLQHFENYAKEDKRFVIKNICKTETIFMISQLGSDTRVSNDSNKVFEEAQVFLKAKMNIPSENYALIIKQLIMKLKEADLFIKRQKIVVQEGLRRESVAVLNKNEIRNIARPDSPADEDAKKYNTQLRVRGEEWRDKFYFEDHPLDGPDLYVIISNFMDPNLPACLMKIGVPIAAIVQLRININAEVPPDLILPSKRVASETDEAERATYFWNNILHARMTPDTSQILQETAFIVFTPPYWDTQKLSADPEQIYDELCYLVYDVQDLTRQHANFKNNIGIIEIPEPNLSENQTLISFYNQQIDDIPLEYVTIYSVLDSLIWTVSCNDLESKTNTTFVSEENKNDNNQHKATNIIAEAFETLCETSKNNKKYRITYGADLDNKIDPLVISYGDTAKCKTYPLGNINMDNIIRKFLTPMPINQLWKYFNSLPHEVLAKTNYHVNVLLSCFERTDIETSELCRLLNLLSCRKLYNNREIMKIQNDEIQSTISKFKNVYLKRSLIAEPISKIPSNYGIESDTMLSVSPNKMKYENESNSISYCMSGNDSETIRIKTLFDCPDISELASAAEIACSCPINHFIDDYDYFEDYQGASALQILHEAYNSFNCVNYKYCEVTDSIIMIFFNSFDKENISREQWRSHIPTAVCLQDFFDYVLEEHIDWIKEEEKKHDEHLKSLRTNGTDGSACQHDDKPKCVNDMEIDFDMLLDGSLKHEELKKIDIYSTTDEIIESTMTSHRETTHIKKNASFPRRTLKIAQPKKLFSAFDLGERRVEAFGKDTKYYATDGTRISSSYYLIIPMLYEWITLNMTLGNSYNEIWIHRAIGQYDIPTENQVSEVRIAGKDGIIINITKKSYEVPFIPGDNSENLQHSSNVVEDSQVAPDIVNYHSLSVTWPNGLFIEPVHENNCATISHIKLTYLKPLPATTEETRCISLNGEVIIFHHNEDIEVLRPDGSYMKITKYGKKVITPPEEEEKESIASNAKNKKPKLKQSKSAKNIEVAKKEVKPTYELFIDEYDLIESNGVMKRYENNNFIFIKKLLIRYATEYSLGEIFSRRMDGTNILLNKDGLQIVTFPEGTRIITQVVVDDEEIFVEWTPDELELLEANVHDFDSDASNVKTKNVSKKSLKSISESSKSKIPLNKHETNMAAEGYVSVHLVHTIEHKNFATITIDTYNGFIKLDSPNGVRIKVLFDNRCNIKLDNSTTVKFDGKDLKVFYKSCTKCKVETQSIVKIFNKSDEESTDNHDKYWLKMKNSFGKVVTVNNQGGITEEDDSEQVKLQCVSSESVNDLIDFLEEDEGEEDNVKSENYDHSKCKEMYEKDNLQFFILHRDLSCTQLLSRNSVLQYRKQYQHHPWFSLNSYPSFGDYRELISMMTPLDLNESDKWLMESKLANIPKHLTYKDLKKDVEGKGFYHWMRPYKSFTPNFCSIIPENVLPPNPRAYVLRTLEKQWTDNKRANLKGAKELIKAILKYRHAIEIECETIMDIPLKDTRSLCEKNLDKVVHDLAARMYEDLKVRVSEEARARVKKGITTKPLPPTEDVSYEDEEQSRPQSIDDEKELRKTLDKVVEMSPLLKRYWRRREELYKEEMFYQYLLREGTVPPYFKNVLGGAIWWEVNNMAGTAVNKSERRKTMCDCDEEKQRRSEAESRAQVEKNSQ